MAAHARTRIHVVHGVPGRVRLRVPGVRGNPELAADLEYALRRVRGVVDVEASATSGSVVVHYARHAGTAWDWSELAGALAREVVGLDAEEVTAYLVADARRRSHRRADAGNYVTRTFRDVDEGVAHATGGVGLALLVPFALATLGVHGFLVSRDVVVPRWYDLLWFGFGTFMMLNAAGVPTTKAAEEAAGVAAAL